MIPATKKLLLMGVALEVAIFAFCFFTGDDLPQVFKLSARYSGRVSALVFLWTFFRFASLHRKGVEHAVRPWLLLFAVVHLIHFGFLATSVILNDSPLELHKVIGGSLAYMMIIVAPFRLLDFKLPAQLVYFYYVTFVMVMTYIARIKGEFQDVVASEVHYGFLGAFLVGSVVFGWWVWQGTKRRSES